MRKALLNTPIREPTQWELDNLERIMLTSKDVWKPNTMSDGNGPPFEVGGEQMPICRGVDQMLENTSINPETIIDHCSTDPIVMRGEGRLRITHLLEGVT